jgi:DNA/RNA-binding domain of Phe-tRNA-synthetase-like protein
MTVGNADTPTRDAAAQRQLQRQPQWQRQWLDDASIDPAVCELRPDYRALIVVADGLRPGPGDEFSESMLAAAEAGACADPGAHPHVAAWHEAFRSFGAKPKRVRPSVDALLRRAPGGLPRIDRLTDIYNAVSVAHVLPIGGEDLDRYEGPAQLVRAEGTEPFEVTVGGAPEVEHPRPGEVVWRDDAGVTCRRWNWRQCVRTRLTTGTTRAAFILDALGPMTDDALTAAGEALLTALLEGSPQAEAEMRLVRGSAVQD